MCALFVTNLNAQVSEEDLDYEIELVAGQTISFSKLSYDILLLHNDSIQKLGYTVIHDDQLTIVYHVDLTEYLGNLFSGSILNSAIKITRDEEWTNIKSVEYTNTIKASDWFVLYSNKLIDKANKERFNLSGEKLETAGRQKRNSTIVSVLTVTVTIILAAAATPILPIAVVAGTGLVISTSLEMKSARNIKDSGILLKEIKYARE